MHPTEVINAEKLLRRGGRPHMDPLEMIPHPLHRLAEDSGLLDGRQTCGSAVLAQGHLQRLALRRHRAPHAARHRLGGRSEAEA